MNLNKNYYSILNIPKNSDKKEIKKGYFALSKKHHPDKGGDEDFFKEISESYTILFNEVTRTDYDKRSRFGNEYDELSELLNYEQDITWDESKYNKFKKDDLLNIIIEVPSPFIGVVEYQRWVICKKCSGNGKDLNSKIVIKDRNGDVIRMFEGDGGCDFCEGSGKDWKGNDCSFCFGAGKIGSSNCKTCDGKKRILGNQKLSGISIPDNFDDPIKVPNMGNMSKDIPGKSGHLFIRVLI